MCVRFGLSAQVCYSTLSVTLFVCPVSLSLCLSLHFASQCTSVHSHLPLSLSLCRSVYLCLLLRNVCRPPFAGQLARKVHAKIDAKIVPKSLPGEARETPNRDKIASGTRSGRSVAPRIVPKASRERLRSVSGRPRGDPGAPGESPKAPRDAKKTAQERPGARRGDQNRCQVAPQSEKTENFLRKSVRKRRRRDFRVSAMRCLQKA